MAQVWVTYPWGHPALISNMSQKSNTYSTTGPFLITCELFDDGAGITEDDILELRYRINNDTTTYIADITDISPAGDGIYGGTIQGDFAAGDVIRYWIYTMDEGGWENDNFMDMKMFGIITPVNPAAQILFVNDGGMIQHYFQFFEEYNIAIEPWDFSNIDEYVLNFGWQAVFVCGNSSYFCQGIPNDTLFNPYKDYLDAWGNLYYCDPGYLFWSEEDSLQFEAGSFAHDYLGIETLYIDPEDAESDYTAPAGSIFQPYFGSQPMHTYSSEYYNPDCYRVSVSEACLQGIDDERIYASCIESGYKLIFSSFEPAMANPLLGDSIVISDEFRDFMFTVLDYFNVSYNSIDANTILQNKTFILYSPYPNPFNQSVRLNYILPAAADVRLSVYDITGREAATLIEGRFTAGRHSAEWDASEQASGVYFVRLSADGGQSSVKKLVLLK